MGWWDDVLSWKARPEPERSEQVRKILAMSTRELEEDLMAKKVVVKFKKTDGLEPRRSEIDGKPFALKLPLPISGRPAGTAPQRIKLGLSCNLPCLVIANGVTEIFAPDQELSVTLTLTEGGYGQGETVARCYPIDCTNMVTEDE